MCPTAVFVLQHRQIRRSSPRGPLYSLLFYCRMDSGDLKIHQAEIDSASFFQIDENPPLLPGVKLCIQHAFEFHLGKRNQTYFDYINSLETDE